MICPNCNGTGRDDTKTQRARDKGEINGFAYVRCWTCNGNGNDDPNGIYERKGDSK